MVDEAHRAWHAGAGVWGDVDDVNSRSIGIELSNDGFSPFSAPLMDALEALLPAIKDRWAVPAHRVIAHSDLAPGRKIDPGARFDWARLARAGLAIKASPTAAIAVNEDAFVRDARIAGYTADVSMDVLLAALRLRHRHGCEGPLDGWDCAIAADLAERFPIAQPTLTS